MQRFFLSFASLRDELNRIHICKSLVEFHATRKQDYNIMVRSRKRCAYDVQRETIVIRLPGYCLPLYLVGNHFERYFSNRSKTILSILSAITYTYSPFLIPIKYSEFPAIEIRSDRWSTITYKITKANERATNKKKKNERKKEKRERKQPITEKFLAKVFLKLEWNVGGHPRRKKFRAKTQKDGIRRRGRFENRLSFTRCEAECTIMLKN